MILNECQRQKMKKITKNNIKLGKGKTELNKIVS